MASEDYSDLIAAANAKKPDDYSDLIAAAGITHEAKPVSAPAQQPDDNGVFARIGRGLGRMGHTFVEGATTTAHVLRHPSELGDPSKRRELERGLDDMVTLGFGQKLADAVTSRPDVAAGMDFLQRHGVPIGERRSLAETAPEDQANAPGYRTAGNLAGMFTPGAVTTLGRGGSAVAGRLLGKLPVSGAFSGAGVGAARALLGYQIGAAPIAAGQAVAQGRDPLDAMKEAATDPAALALAGTLGGVGGAGRGIATSIRDPKSMSGRVIRDVQQSGGPGAQINTFGTPTEGGLYESPELSELPRGRAGVNELAGKSTGRIVDANQQRLEHAREAWGEAADEIIKEHGNNLLPAKATHEALKAIDNENTVNGVVGDDKVAAATAKIRKMLTSETEDIDRMASAKAGHLIYQTAPEVTAEDMIRVRKLVNRMYRHTQEPSEKHVYGAMLDALADDAGAADPRIMQLNRDYRQEMKSLSATNDAIFGQKKPELRDTEGVRQTGAARLGRAGDETQAGTLAEPRLANAEKESPQASREMRLIRAKKAQERLRYGKPELSMPIEQGMGTAAEHGAKKVAGVLLGHHFGGPIGAYLGSKMAEALGNPLATRVRIALPLADTVGQIYGSPLASAAAALLGLPSSRIAGDQ